MQNSRHKIDKLKFHVSYDNERKSKEIGDKISRSFHERISTILEEVLNEFDDEFATFKFESLELDLPQIQENKLENLLPEKIKETLRELLQEKFNSLKKNSDAIEVESEEKRNLYLVQFYLKNGFLPWWANSLSKQKFFTILEKVIENHFQKFVEILRENIRNSVFVERLIITAKIPKIERIIKKLSPNEATFILQAIQTTKKVQRKKQLFKIAFSRFEIEIYKIVLQYLLLERGSIFNTKDFVRHLFFELASNYNENQISFFIKMHQTILETGFSSNLPSDFISVLQLIYKDLQLEIKNKNKISEQKKAFLLPEEITEESLKKWNEEIQKRIAIDSIFLKELLEKKELVESYFSEETKRKINKIEIQEIKEKEEFSSLLLYLKTGSLEVIQNFTFQEILKIYKKNIRRKSKEIVLFFKQEGKKETVQKKIVQLLNTAQIKQLIQLLEPSNYEAISDFSEKIDILSDKRKEITNQTSFRKKKWEFILISILTEKGSVFNFREFIKRTLQLISKSYSISYRELLQELMHDFSRIKAFGKFGFLKEILEGLHVEESTKEKKKQKEKQYKSLFGIVDFLSLEEKREVLQLFQFIQEESDLSLFLVRYEEAIKKRILEKSIIVENVIFFLLEGFLQFSAKKNETTIFQTIIAFERKKTFQDGVLKQTLQEIKNSYETKNEELVYYWNWLEYFLIKRENPWWEKKENSFEKIFYFLFQKDKIKLKKLLESNFLDKNTLYFISKYTDRKLQKEILKLLFPTNENQLIQYFDLIISIYKMFKIININEEKGVVWIDFVKILLENKTYKFENFLRIHFQYLGKKYLVSYNEIIHVFYQVIIKENISSFEKIYLVIQKIEKELEQQKEKSEFDTLDKKEQFVFQNLSIKSTRKVEIYLILMLSKFKKTGNVFELLKIEEWFWKYKNIIDENIFLELFKLLEFSENEISNVLQNLSKKARKEVFIQNKKSEKWKVFIEKWQKILNKNELQFTNEIQLFLEQKILMFLLYKSSQNLDEFIASFWNKFEKEFILNKKKKELVFLDFQQEFKTEKRDFESKKTEDSKKINEKLHILYKEEKEEELVFENVTIFNAGLILFWPFITQLFQMLELLNGNKFKDTNSQVRAIFLLHYLVYKEESCAEFEVYLNKLLCGFPLNSPIETDFTLEEKEKEILGSLLQGIKANWSPMKTSSDEALKETFLQREGVLIHKENEIELHIEKKTVDILLEKLSWSFTNIKLPWMEKVLIVKWI
ncbi:contractile injection system tape measure protein [Aureivirga marina]|uniref:contractile injection system tape measure protein n=1 Tax=Aureivirga marina TaxID=1182451 RepID=UPI0018CA1BD1|nr:contractile injection system tape measure protein [Aureivirga marina]